MTGPIFPASSFYTTHPPHQLTLSLASGKTAAFSTQTAGISFFAYIPRSHPISQLSRTGSLERVTLPTTPYPLAILVHGSGRDAEVLRNSWAEWAESRGVVLLVPLFPIDIEKPEGIDNYKTISYTRSDSTVLRYDAQLLDMIERLTSQWGFIDPRDIIMCGFSGGAQFVHRFWYLYPSMLCGVSIGAPGNVASLNRTTPWPRGVGDVEAIFGKPVDLSSVKQTAVQLIVGLADNKKRQNYTETRLETMQGYSRMLGKEGILHTLELVPDVAHEEDKLQTYIMAFADRCLVQRTRLPLSTQLADDKSAVTFNPPLYKHVEPAY